MACYTCCEKPNRSKYGSIIDTRILRLCLLCEKQMVVHKLLAKAFNASDFHVPTNCIMNLFGTNHERSSTKCISHKIKLKKHHQQSNLTLLPESIAVYNINDYSWIGS
jgi:hypothetical protein